MQDSYKELLDDSLVIELVDSEVNWIDWHKEINEFLDLKPLWKIYQFTIDTTNRKRLQILDEAFWLNLFHHEAKWNWIKNHVTENEYWKDKKILIKDVSSKYGTLGKYGILGEYGAYLNNLSLVIKNNRRELNITDNDLQDLKKRREELIFIVKSLDSLIWNDWGRDHEQKGGEYIIHAEKREKTKRLYFPKFHVSKLWGILHQHCKIENVGGNYSNHSATYFTTSEGEEVYITGRFLDLLYNIFGLRLSTFDKIIQHLEPKNTKTVKPQEQTKGYDLGLSESQLETLHGKLINGTFLDETTKLEHFKNAFNGQVLNDFVKLKWLQKDTTLSLFIALLNHKNPWKIAESVFENCDSGNLRKTYSNCNKLDIHKLNISLFKSILP